MPASPPATFVAAGFDLGTVRLAPRYVARGELGDVWKLDTSTGQWAVKQLRSAPDATTGHDLDFQLAVLSAGDVPMPCPMLTVDGRAVLVEPATGIGYRTYEWVEHVPGASADPQVAGQLLARVHAVQHPAVSIDPWFYVPVGEDELRSHLREAHVAGVAWAPLLERRFGDLVETLAAVPGTPPRRLLSCHLDFGPDNVLLDRSGRPWVIDWENSGGGDPDQELAQAMTFFGADVLAGYRSGGGPAELRGLESFAMTFAVQANYLAHCLRHALASGPDVARYAATIERLLDDLVTVDAARRLLP